MPEPEPQSHFGMMLRFPITELHDVFFHTSQVKAGTRGCNCNCWGGGGWGRASANHPHPPPSFKPQLVAYYKQRNQQNPQTHQQVAP